MTMNLITWQTKKCRRLENLQEPDNDLLKNLKIKQTALEYQIKTQIGVSCTRLENLTKVVEDILDNVRWRDNIPDLESKESAAQRRTESSSRKRLNILTPTPVFNRLPISLA